MVGMSAFVHMSLLPRPASMLASSQPSKSVPISLLIVTPIKVHTGESF